MKSVTWGTIYKRGEVWWWEHRQNGERKYVSLDTSNKETAMAKRKSQYNQLCGVSERDIAIKDLPNLAEITYGARGRPSTLTVVRRVSKYFADHCPVKMLSELTHLHFDQYVALLRANKNRASNINLHFAYLRALVTRISPKGYNPFMGYPKLKEDDSREVLPLPPDVVQGYLSAAKLYNKDTYHELTFMACTGCRESSLRLVRAKDVNEIDQTVVVTLWKTVRSNGNRSTIVPIHETLLPILLERKQGKAPDDLLFPPRVMPGKLAREMVTIARRHHLPHGHPHQLRHTFASETLRATGDLDGVMKIMGLANMSTAKRYLDSTLQTKRNVIASVKYTKPPDDTQAQEAVAA